MNDLGEISRRVARLQERLVSAAVFSAAAAGCALVVPSERRFMVCVSFGAAGWVMVELMRLHIAGDDQRHTIDQLILAGSSDPRCDQRRTELRSARLQHGLARLLRQTCARSHARGAAIDWLLDWRTVQAVEDDLQQLAEVVDRGAGHIPPEAVVRIGILVASSASPLCVPHTSPRSSRRAIRDAQRIIDRCRADLPD
jgi:hypothetical protein